MAPEIRENLAESRKHFANAMKCLPGALAFAALIALIVWLCLRPGNPPTVTTPYLIIP